MKKIGSGGQKITKQRLSRALLKPFSWIYGWVTGFRNFLYDREILKSASTSQFAVVVGNLTVGGTGKTPIVEFLIRNLGQANKTVTLSRGYGRRSRGFVLASPNSTAADIGDEPMQYYEKFGQKVPVAVCEKRILGAQMLYDHFPNHELLLLDDAFQHRALRSDVAILLNDFNRPFYHDNPFPGGRLRESRRGARRADVIITTKCPPDLNKMDKAKIRQEIAEYTAPGTPCYFASVRYGELRSFTGSLVSGQSFVLVTGIAQPQPLQKYVAENFDLAHTLSFSDHHEYTLKEAEEMLKSLKKEQMILTTEKDRVKLRPLAAELGAASRFCYLPIEVDFGNETAAFHEWLRAHVDEPLKARSVSI